MKKYTITWPAVIAVGAFDVITIGFMLHILFVQKAGWSTSMTVFSIIAAIVTTVVLKFSIKRK